MFYSNENAVGIKVVLTADHWTEKGIYTRGHVMRIKRVERSFVVLEDDNDELTLPVNGFRHLEGHERAETMPEEQYLILHTFTTNGDCAIWWGPDHNGYTTDIDKAGRYTKAEADKIYKNRPKLDKPIPWSEVEPHIRRHVLIDRVRGLGPPDLRDTSES